MTTSTPTNASRFYLSMGALSDDSVAQLQPSFASLPSSAYRDGGYRPRRYSQFQFIGGSISLLPHQPFVQSSDLNEFQGDVARDYEDIEASCYESDGFQAMFQTFYDHAGLPGEVIAEVHQMRVVCQGDETVETAPEGVHQDGFRRIGMFFLGYENITGGEIKAYTEKAGAPIVNYRFKDGEYMVMDDNRFWHHANPITPINADQPAYYDVFVITADKVAAT